jgi:chromate transporter
MGSSALIFWYFRSPHSIVFCLIAGAIFSLYIEMENKQQMSQRSQNLFHRINTGWLLGKNSFYIFIGLFALLWFIASHDGQVWYSYSYIFYFCGAFVIGPATTVFAYIYAFVHELNLIPDHLFWVGLPFAFLLPGSVVNGVLYFGVLLDGFRGMMVAAISFYIPCFITLYGILPNWKYYREKPGVQRLTKGLACVSTGLMIALVCIDLILVADNIGTLRQN